MSWSDDLDTGITHLTRSDPVLADLISAHPKPSFKPHQNYYEELLRSIVSQQLSVKAAATIHTRFIEGFGHTPTPDELLASKDDRLRSYGLSGQKARYVKDLAHNVLTGDVSFDHFDTLSNEQIVSELTSVKGIGEWTVHMFLIFCMGRLDVLPTGDLGVKNAMIRAYNLPKALTPDDMRDTADRNDWSPYESIASWYLWRSLANEPVRAASSLT